MKNIKVVFFIMLGAFLMATGFAFAAPTDSPTYKKLQGGVWDTPSADCPALKIDLVPSKDAASVKTAADTKAPVTKAPPAVSTPAPTSAPSFSDQLKSFIKDNSEKITMSAVGAYVGFALFGPVGIILGAMFMFALDYMGNASS
jgi:hypothetical protein